MRDLILHNPRCSKSREALRLLETHGAAVEVVPYLEQPPSVAELRALCRLLARRPQDLVRTKEALFGELGYSIGEAVGESQWLERLAAHPRLLERPIVVYRGRAVLGRPPEAVLGLL